MCGCVDVWMDVILNVLGVNRDKCECMYGMCVNLIDNSKVVIERGGVLKVNTWTGARGGRLVLRCLGKRPFTT